MNDGRGLLMEIMRYSRELKAAEPFFDELPKKELDEEMVTLATELIERKSVPFDPTAFEDRYAITLRELVEKKAMGRKIVATTDADITKSAEVIDLMDALKKSVSQKPKTTKTTRSSSRSRRKPEKKRTG